MTRDENQPMSLSHASEEFVRTTTQASAITRSLGLSLLAVVWLFGGGVTSAGSTPEVVLDHVQAHPSLYVALVAALLALTLDLLQYVWGAAAWGVLQRVLDDVLERDTGHGDADHGRLRAAWARARLIGLVDQLEGVSGLDPGPEWPQRRSRLRELLHPDSVTTRTLTDEQVAVAHEWLDKPVHPPALSIVTNSFLALKFIALVVGYVAFLGFVLS